MVGFAANTSWPLKGLDHRRLISRLRHPARREQAKIEAFRGSFTYGAPRRVDRLS
jgi:hypothetical protein